MGDGRVGGLGIDSAVSEWLETAPRNRGAMTDRQRRDATRITLRIDIPDWLKASVVSLAERENISVSNAACVLLAWSLAVNAATVEQFIEQNKTAVRSLNSAFEVVLDDLQEMVTNSAESSVSGQ